MGKLNEALKIPKTEPASKIPCDRNEIFWILTPREKYYYYYDRSCLLAVLTERRVCSPRQEEKDSFSGYFSSDTHSVHRPVNAYCCHKLASFCVWPSARSPFFVFGRPQDSNGNSKINKVRRVIFFLSNFASDSAADRKVKTVLKMFTNRVSFWVLSLSLSQLDCRASS